jgi:hypothetical protein
MTCRIPQNEYTKHVATPSLWWSGLAVSAQVSSFVVTSTKPRQLEVGQRLAVHGCHSPSSRLITHGCGRRTSAYVERAGRFVSGSWTQPSKSPAASMSKSHLFPSRPPAYRLPMKSCLDLFLGVAHRDSTATPNLDVCSAPFSGSLPKKERLPFGPCGEPPVSPGSWAYVAPSPT